MEATKTESSDAINTSNSNDNSNADLKSKIDKLSRELEAAKHDRNQSAALGLELITAKENLQREYETIKSLYEQSKIDLQELRDAFNKAINEQRISATTVFEKEVQLLNDSDALAASFTVAKQEIEKELKLTKSQLNSTIIEKDRFLNERDELTRRITSLEQERKTLKAELKDINLRETKLLNENSELEEENVGLQKQVSNLRRAQVEFESSKHEIQRLQDEVNALNSHVEEVVTLKRITERQMQDALEALQSEREQKYALRKELDKRNSTDPLINWTSLAALKGSPRLANLALRGLSTAHRSTIPREVEDDSPNGYNEDGGNAFSDNEQTSYDIIHELEMPSIEGSLFDEVHLTEIKKLQQNLEEKENQRSNLNTKLIEIQHKLESKSRRVDEIEEKLVSICSLVEDIYNESDIQKLSSPVRKQADFGQLMQQADETKNNNSAIDGTSSSPSNNNETSATNSAPKQKILENFDNVYSHLQTIFNELKSYQKGASINKENISIKKEIGLGLETNLIDHAITDGDKKLDTSEVLQSNNVQDLRAMLYKKTEQLKQLRTVLKSNKESAEVALENLKSKYEMEKAIVAETTTKLKLDLKRLNEDAATFASLRSDFSERIEDYNTEIEKLQSKLTASEQEKNTLNSILRMAIEQKVMLTQKLEALEMDREEPQLSGSSSNKSSNGHQQRPGAIRNRGGSASNRSLRPSRPSRSGGSERR